MSLVPIDYLNGFSSLTYVIVSILVGLTILSKYFKYNQRPFLFVGITWLGLSEPWIPSSLSFLSNLLFGQGLSLELYIIIGNILTPISLVSWMIAFTDLIYKQHQSLIVGIYAIIGIVFTIVFINLLFTNPTAIGTFSSDSQVNIDIEYKSFVMIYLVFIVINLLITGSIFARNSLKSNQREVKLKGKFLLIAFIAWCIGAVFDSAIPLNFITLPITRLLLVSSALLFYIGFILPPGIKKLFISE
ncbi:MAG: hypothetical protein ACOC44_14315 [Promethearchaeia archaeon]